VIHPKFKSLPFLGGGHRQTLAAFLIKGKRQPYQAIQHVFDLDDVDRTILHDDSPPGWTDSDPVALMLHGLAGCHGSDYMVRIADKLTNFSNGFSGLRCGQGPGAAPVPFWQKRRPIGGMENGSQPVPPFPWGRLGVFVRREYRGKDGWDVWLVNQRRCRADLCRGGESTDRPGAVFSIPQPVEQSDLRQVFREAVNARC